MSNSHAEFACLPTLGLRLACEFDLPLLLDGIVVGGGLATLALVAWRYRRGRGAARTASTSLRKPMLEEDQHADRDPPPP